MNTLMNFRHYLGTVSTNCKYDQTSVSIDCGGEKFSLTGKKVTDPGFTSIMSWQAIPPDESLPNLSQGAKLSVKEVKLAERQTSPPGYLTEADLITLMEKHGIGTDASIPVHINNICTRNYVTIESGRRLVPTNLGIVLVHGYLKIDPDLVKPTMRSAVEKQLDLIAQGKADFGSVLAHTLEVFKLKFLYFVKNITGMDQLFEVSFSSLASSGRPFSRCGKCRRFMKLVEAKPKRLFCSTGHKQENESTHNAKNRRDSRQNRRKRSRAGQCASASRKLIRVRTTHNEETKKKTTVPTFTLLRPTAPRFSIKH